MFSSNSRITPLETEYGYIAVLNNMFKSTDKKSGLLTVGLYYDDTATVAAVDNPDPNAGLSIGRTVPVYSE